MTIDIATVRPYARPYVATPGNPRVQARLDPALAGELAHAAQLWAIPESEIVRRALRLLFSGYPTIDPRHHAWLLRLAAANDLDADPHTALAALLDQHVRRYPAAGRLDGT